MDQLLSFLQNSSPLHPLLASFFTKAMIACFDKFCSRTVAYLEKQSDFFDRLVDHIETSAIMNLLNNILTNRYKNIESGTAVRMPVLISFISNQLCNLIKFFFASLFMVKWINSSNIVSKIVNVFKVKDSVESHENAADLLCELIHHFQSQFAMEEKTKISILQDIERCVSVFEKKKHFK